MLTAALRLVVREGCPAVTVKGIAEEAGVGRQTVYRWWSTKADVVVEAVADLAARASRPTPTDDTVADIRRNLRSNFAAGRGARDLGPDGGRGDAVAGAAVVARVPCVASATNAAHVIIAG